MFNERIKAAGFERSIEEYVADLMGEDAKFKALKLSEIKRL